MQDFFTVIPYIHGNYVAARMRWCDLKSKFIVKHPCLPATADKDIAMDDAQDFAEHHNLDYSSLKKCPYPCDSTWDQF